MGDFRVLIGQNFYLNYLVPSTLEILDRAVLIGPSLVNEDGERIVFDEEIAKIADAVGKMRAALGI